MDKLINILTSVGKVNILVIGDLMLDKYVWGGVKRISQEAPIPILNVEYEEVRPGGAGNVINNLVQLGAMVYGCGVVGDDPEGDILIQEINRLTSNTFGIFKDKTRRTILKTRLMGHLQSAGKGVQQLLRVDYENTHPVPLEIEEKISSYLRISIPICNIVIISDMDKGLLSERIINTIRHISKEHAVPVIVDPKLGGDYSLYRGLAAITPNRFETELGSGVKITSMESLKTAGKILSDSLDMENILITIDKDGMFFYSKDGRYSHIPTSPKEVYDVSGAGDVVISVLGYLLAGGCGFEDSARIANIAAGIEVVKLGAMPVSKREILNELMNKHDPLNNKIKIIGELIEALNDHRNKGERIVFTNGCFDILHIGHIEYLKFSRLQGDVLVVGLNSDRSVRSLKGPKRPFVSENERARLLAALEGVAYVVLFDEATPESLIKMIRPDVLVKGEDWADAGVVGREFVESYGGKVVLAPFVKGMSTTNLVSRIVEKHHADAQSSPN